VFQRTTSATEAILHARPFANNGATQYRRKLSRGSLNPFETRRGYEICRVLEMKLYDRTIGDA